VHLRWDFVMNRKWIIFSTGGLGGLVASSFSSFWLHPRFSAGANYRFGKSIYGRIELSHEWSLVGLQFNL
jgi:hypothetical protein